MSTIRILSLSGAVLYESEAPDVRAALVEAVAQRIVLGCANLDGAYLHGANLRGADLRGADLGGAYLGGANLHGANLGGAYLGGADLRGAYLHGANLGGAYLHGAYLHGANLGGAYLHGAYLHGANLGGAYLGNRRVLQIAGSRDWIVVIQTPESVDVSIGCCRHDLPHWLEHYQGIGRQYGYTSEQIEEYGAHLRHVEAWARMASVPIAEPAQTGEVAP
jgi:hypothetical protein